MVQGGLGWGVCGLGYGESVAQGGPGWGGGLWSRGVQGGGVPHDNDNTYVTPDLQSRLEKVFLLRSRKSKQSFVNEAGS